MKSPARLRGWSGLLAGALLVACAPEPAPEPSAQPGLLLLTVDTLRPDYMSLNGYELPTTPYLDALLSEGWYFDEALAPIARTTPALASLMTGAYPHTTRVRTLSSDLGEGIETLAGAMRQAGYQTLATVTNHVLLPERELDRGFERYGFHREILDAADVTRHALDQIASADASRPLFSWVHYLDPHIPYTATDAQLETFDPGYEGPFQNAFHLRPPQDGEVDARERDRLRGQQIHRGRLEPRVQEHVRRLYAASIRTFDDSVRAVVDAMRERHGGNLIVVFTSDHGESLGEHDYFWDHGDYVYAAELRVPLGFVLPEQHALHGAGRCSGWVSLVDVVPTLLELFEWPPPDALADQLEGRSLAACMRGEALPPAPQFSESGKAYHNHLNRRRVRFDIAGRLRSVVLGDWKLIWNPYQQADLEWELYDLRIDPFETRNFYSPRNPRVPILREALARWMTRQAADESLPELSEEDREALRAMGYLE